jgi:hypothetical protein
VILTAWLDPVFRVFNNLFNDALVERGFTASITELYLLIWQGAFDEGGFSIYTRYASRI